MEEEDYIKRSDALKAILGVSIYDTIEELEGARTIAENTWADGLWDAYKIIEEEVDAADVEPKQRWIPVTEGLPEEKISPMTMDYTEYPCVFDGRAGQREVRYYKFGKGHFWHGSGCIDEYVTHWAEPMPLPEPPKEADDGEL